MNVRVETGPINVGVMINVVEPTLNVEVRSPRVCFYTTTRTCLSLASLSVNGHSISAINPELELIGGMATSAMA